MENNNDLTSYVDRLKNVLKRHEGANREAVRELTELQLFNRVLLEREAKRLKSKLGSDHPRTKAIADGLKQNLNVINSLENEFELSRLKVPEVSKDDTLLHGRIADEYGRGVAGVKIILKSSAGDRLSAADIITDESGYFSYKFEPAAMEKIADEKVNITIVDNQGEIIHQPHEPLRMKAGEHKLLRTVVNKEKAYPWLRRAKQGASGGETIRAKKRTTDRPAVGKKKTVTAEKEKQPRYLGNSHKREIHDLRCTTKNCQIEKIKPDHRVPFKTLKKGLEAGYDYCAYCFGKDRSKR